MLEIRAAVPADVPELARLLAELFAQEAEFQPDAAVQARGLALIVAAPAAGRVLIATDHARTVGMLNLLYVVSTALGGRVAILEDMVVTRTGRSQGAGTQLLGKAIETCRADGCLRITLLTDADNSRAHRFYERAGFTRSTMLPYRLLLD